MRASEWGFLSESDEILIGALKAAASEAVSNGTPMRLTLKGGEVVEGVLDRVRVDASNSPTVFNSPLVPEERDRFGPNEVIITIGGTEVLAQEVESFNVMAD